MSKKVYSCVILAGDGHVLAGQGTWKNEEGSKTDNKTGDREWFEPMKTLKRKKLVIFSVCQASLEPDRYWKNRLPYRYLFQFFMIPIPSKSDRNSAFCIFDRLWGLALSQSQCLQLHDQFCWMPLSRDCFVILLSHEMQANLAVCRLCTTSLSRPKSQ